MAAPLLAHSHKLQIQQPLLPGFVLDLKHSHMVGGPSFQEWLKIGLEA